MIRAYDHDGSGRFLSSFVLSGQECSREFSRANVLMATRGQLSERHVLGVHEILVTTGLYA